MSMLLKMKLTKIILLAVGSVGQFLKALKNMPTDK